MLDSKADITSAIGTFAFHTPAYVPLLEPAAPLTVPLTLVYFAISKSLAACTTFVAGMIVPNAKTSAVNTEAIL